MGPTLAQLLLIGAALLGWYALACWMFPYRSCRKCTGGKVRTRSGAHWAYCRRCGGVGGKPRLGRRVWDALH
jgi:hypothetical protein